MTSGDLLFVSIASYRDAQLVPTLLDCLQKAQHPARLRFGICWQHDPGEPPLPFAEDPRFRILAIPWRESRGACWARAEIMKLTREEPWFLQVDSHCRFTEAWDTKLIAAAALTSSPKPILSTYASPFSPALKPDQREILGGPPQLMAFLGFTPESIPTLKPNDLPGWQTRSTPMRARFLAAGFLFTTGAFVHEVPYDPELYFFGEEISMTLRAFTHGYDLFHPRETILWHDYVRTYAKRHWDDHTSANDVVHPWSHYDQPSREKVARLLRGEPIGSFGLGTARTLADYESWAGLSFHLRKVQDYTRRSLEPPNPPADPDWPSQIYTWLVRIVFDPRRLAPAAFKDQQFWYVTLKDEAGHEIYRHDFPAAELATFTGTEPKIALVCELESGIIPATWTVWPVSHALGWLSRIHGTLTEGDYAIITEDDTAPEPPDPSRPDDPVL